MWNFSANWGSRPVCNLSWGFLTFFFGRASSREKGLEGIWIVGWERIQLRASARSYIWSQPSVLRRFMSGMFQWNPRHNVLRLTDLENRLMVKTSPYHQTIQSLNPWKQEKFCFMMAMTDAIPYAQQPNGNRGIDVGEPFGKLLHIHQIIMLGILSRPRRGSPQALGILENPIPLSNITLKWSRLCGIPY